MFEWGLAPWLWAGLLLGGAATVVIAALFVAGERWFPAPDRRAGEATDGPGAGPRGGDERRRAEMREYLSAIDEPFREDATVEGHEVAFLLPERSVAVTFDAGAYLALRESSVQPVLAEHELPGAALGRRLPFETPTHPPGEGPSGHGPGPAAGPGTGRGPGASFGPGSGGTAGGGDAGAGPGAGRAAGDPALAASLSKLGFPEDADPDPEELRRAYRSRAKELHPDHGGDEAEFRELAEAYATASERVS